MNFNFKLLINVIIVFLTALTTGHLLNLIFGTNKNVWFATIGVSIGVMMGKSIKSQK